MSLYLSELGIYAVRNMVCCVLELFVPYGHSMIIGCVRVQLLSCLTCTVNFLVCLTMHVQIRTIKVYVSSCVKLLCGVWHVIIHGW